MRPPMFIDVLRTYPMRYAITTYEYGVGRFDSHFCIKAGSFWGNNALLAQTRYGALMDAFLTDPIILSVTGIKLILPEYVRLAAECVHLKNALSYKPYGDMREGEIFILGMGTKEASYSLWKLPLGVELHFMANRLSSTTFTIERRALKNTPSPWALLSIFSGTTDKIVGQAIDHVAATVNEIVAKKLV